MLFEENQFIGLQDLNVCGDVGWYGSREENVNCWSLPSKVCSTYSTVMLSIARHVRQWQCPVCGVVHDREVNAVINILNQPTVGATESNAWGQPVGPEFAAATGQRWTIQEAILL